MLPVVTRGKCTQTSCTAKGSDREKEKCFTKRRRRGGRETGRHTRKNTSMDGKSGRMTAATVRVHQGKTNETFFHRMEFIPFDCCEVMMNCESSTEGQQLSTVIIAGSAWLTASARFWIEVAPRWCWKAECTKRYSFRNVTFFFSNWRFLKLIVKKIWKTIIPSVHRWWHLWWYLTHKQAGGAANDEILSAVVAELLKSSGAQNKTFFCNKLMCEMLFFFF